MHNGTSNKDGIFKRPFGAHKLPRNQNDLSQMVREVIGSTQQNAQAISRWIFSVVLIGHGHVTFQPLLWGKTSKLFEQAIIHVRPVLLQFWNRWQLRDCFIGLGHEYRVELWMQSLTNAENCVYGIVDCCKVTEKIENSVPARCYFQQELLFC